ncbi:MAG TPA: class III lanthionine synthetase LanKC [Amycolatopsis sp.]|nr:class III lanthionine synthetase LanKC [Amycolatopsis sp.]
MDLEYEAFCFADPLFFDEQRGATHPDDNFDKLFPQPSHGWVSAESGVWRYLRPVEDDDLPEQGWKIHVSGTPSNVDKVLAAVHHYCLNRTVAFKHLRTRSMVLAHNSKYAAREASGKLATIYPKDEKELETVLRDLDAELGGEPGPYILSDLRYGAGPLYVRYGGFSEQWVEDGGRRVLAIRKPDGTLVPDRRTPVFHLPDWLELPECLTTHLAARQAGDPQQFPYRVTSSLHFSNGGGVYVATHKASGEEAVLKEARPHAGLDLDRRDAVARLHREHEVLQRLAGIPGIPAARELFTVWEHHFLAMERVEGRPLGSWLARNYPLTRRDADDRDLPRYAERALALLARLDKLVAAVHERGIVFGDLHPMNVLIDDDDQVSLVDFELAFDVTGPGRPTLGAPGFKPPRDRTGFAIDEYALAALKLWIFLPLNAMLELAPGKLAGLVGFVQRRFDLPPGYSADVLSVLGSSDAEPEPHMDRSLLSKSIAVGILASATPERTDRLFPGDIEQFSVGGACFAVGAAGVLHALHVAGAERHQEYERWLIESVRRDPPTRPGFYDGAHGIAYVLENFGYHDEAGDLVASSAGLVEQTRDHGLYSGLAGIGLNLLHFAKSRDDTTFRDQAIRLGVRIADTQPEPPGKFAKAGLIHGWSGPALLFVRLYESTGDEAWLDLADRALCRDLEECVTADDGSIQVRDGEARTLPYLAVGSAGIAVVADVLAAHRPAAESVTRLPGLRDSCGGEFVIQPGLLYGRAGLMTAAPATAEAHLSRLGWHAVPYGGGVAFPGNRLLRLSMDVATGGAGVLLALAALDGSAVLPFLGGPQTPVASDRGSNRER